MVTVQPSIRAAARALYLNKTALENYHHLRKIDSCLGIKVNYIPKNRGSIKAENKKIYPSMGSAARTLGIYQASISFYLKVKRTKPFKGKYIFKLVY